MQSGLSRNPPSGSPGSDGPTQLALSAEPLEGRGVADFGAFPFESEQQHNVMNAADPHNLLGSSPFQDFSFPFQDTRDQDDHMSDLEDHQDGNDVAADQADISAAGERPDTIAAGYANSEALRERQPSDSRSDDGAYDGAYDGNHATGHSMEDHASDEFGFSVHPSGNGTGLGGKLKQHGKSDAAPAWSELKTKAGKERKRLPLACASCRRKKIRCSGEKPACKHCIRSRIPCVYKVTTRRAAPRTDYMAMLDKRLKRMEDRIIKIVPKSEQDASAATVVRATVKPPLPGTLSAAGKQATKKRTADEAFSTELESWAKSKSTPEDSSKNGLLQTQEEEENKILHEGQDALPSKELQEHLAEVYFEVVYGQAYHLLHKPSYMRKLRAGTLPPVLVLAVCAVSARFSSHSAFAGTQNFLRGEEWAAPARDIVKRRYEWPNITILTCYLLLALHEFGTCHGGRSWMLAGDAIRMAFALQLHKDVERNPDDGKGSSQLSFVDREIRRRTMWASFLMDRFNSSGIDRPIFIKEEDVKIQLPIREKLFQLDMPGPTEDLIGQTPQPVADDVGQLSSVKENMGVAAYMIRAIALWGRIISYLNQGGRDRDPFRIWEDGSHYALLLTQAEAFAQELPKGLKYSSENLQLHFTEKMVNQFLFLHISIQQNILFMNRFAISSPTGTSQPDAPKEFVTKAGAKAFAAANRISDLLKDAESHFVAAPFVGYCAFLSSTVHIFGIFSGNVTLESAAKNNLATNIKFLGKMKRYWGMFHFMVENLREQYRSCMDAAKKGTSANEKTTVSPVFQYGDWFAHYPHGVSASDFCDPSTTKKKDLGDDGVLEQKPELHTVEEYFTQLSPAQSHESREHGSNTQQRRKSMGKKGGASKGDTPSLEPIITDLSSSEQADRLPPRAHQAQEPQQPPQQQQPRRTASIPRLNPHRRGSNAPRLHEHSNFAGISPISPSPSVMFPHQPHTPNLYNQHELMAMSLSSNPAGVLPQLDRQLVFNAYGNNLDPTTISGPEAVMDWDALAGSNAGNQNHIDAQYQNRSPDQAVASRGGEVRHEDPTQTVSNNGFLPDSSSAWFMPFNLDPPELTQDLNVAGIGPGIDPFGGMFSQAAATGAMQTSGGGGYDGRRGGP